MRVFIAFLCVLVLGGSHGATAQDSTARDTTIRAIMPKDYGRRGFGFWGSGALTRNSNFAAIRQTLTTAGADPSSIGDYQQQYGFSLISETRRGYTESRFLYTTAGDERDENMASLTKQTRFYGFGLGIGYTWTLVNTRRFIVGPSLGYQFMWYRLAVKPQNARTIPLNAVVANPATFNTVRFRQGFYWEGYAALSAEVRVYWFKKLYDEIRFGARVGYQLPLVASRTWSYDDGRVPELPAFRSNMLFAQFGATFFAPARPAANRPDRTRRRGGAL
jgi:hypothetical protein